MRPRKRAPRWAPFRIWCVKRSELFSQFRHDAEQVAHKPVIGDLEDRRFFILVDGNDDFRVFHACKVLDRPRNTDRDIQVPIATTLAVWPTC